MTQHSLHVGARLGASFGFEPDSDVVRDARHALGEGWEALCVPFRALGPDWELELMRGSAFTMRVAEPAFQDAVWDELPGGQILRNVADTFVEATFDALCEARWTVTVSILHLQSRFLKPVHRVALFSEVSSAWVDGYLAALGEI